MYSFSPQTKDSKQKLVSKQKVIQDLNFSHEIVFGMLSTLESLALALSLNGNYSKEYANKMFKHYDRVDYSPKGIFELKSQLQNHIMLVRSSFYAF